MSDVGLETDSCNELSVDALLETVFEEALMTRLCRLPPPAFRSHLERRRGFASGGLAAKMFASLTESRSLSAREAAKPHNQMRC
jgi:hypothetical protein